MMQNSDVRAQATRGRASAGRLAAAGALRSIGPLGRRFWKRFRLAQCTIEAG